MLKFIIVILLILIFLGFIKFVHWFLNQPETKGKIAESFVAHYLKKLDPQKYRVMNDVMIPDQDGGTTQIDHLVLSPYGIFVIETKCWQGEIFGNRKSKMWTQKFSYQKKRQFQNPFNQNIKHIECLASLVCVPKAILTSVVAFVGNGELKDRETLTAQIETSGGAKMKDGFCVSEKLVVGLGDLLVYIQQYTTARFSMILLDEIQNAISNGRIANSRRNKRAHIEYVEQVKSSKKKQMDPFCPNCASKMVQRTQKQTGDANNF